MNIMLVCALGMSTGMLVERMKEYALSEGKDYKIWAVDQNSVESEIGNFDVLLMGPQISYLLSDVKEIVGEEIPVEVIAPVDYGRMNGAAVVKKAEQLISR